MKSSIGIKIIGWVQIIGVLALWIWFLITKAVLFGNLWLLYFLVYSIIILITAIGILSLKNWARLVTIFLYAIKAIEILYKFGDRLFIQKPLGLETIIAYLFTLIPSFFIIWFFTRKSIKEQYRIVKKIEKK